MYPAPIHQYILAVYPKVLKELNLDKVIEKLYKENGISETKLLKEYKSYKKNSLLDLGDISKASNLLT